jgi:hypothetical protein
VTASFHTRAKSRGRKPAYSKVLASTARAPGCEGRVRLVAAVVDDPYDGTRLTVVRNAGDPVEDLLSRRQIDEAQYRAALRVRMLHERAGAVGARAIDYSREHVDGGQIYVDVPLGQAEAAQGLRAVCVQLGMLDYQIVIAIAGEGRRVAEVASVIGGDSEAARKYVGRRFRDALNTLVSYWGFGTTAKARA